MPKEKPPSIIKSNRLSSIIQHLEKPASILTRDLSSKAVLPKQKYKSPSTIKSRLIRSVKKHLERPKPSMPNTRAAKKTELTKQYGLPENSKFLFLKKGRKYGRPRLSLTHGTVVCLDADTSELLLVVRFVEPQEGMNEELFKTYDQAISTIYQHAKARNEVLGNGATYRGRRQGHKFGRMYAAGFRPGYDRIVKCGHYTWNDEIANDLYKMEADLKRQGNLPGIESFFAERFSSLSLFAFDSNATLAAETNAPSWANESFYVTPNSKVFGSNIVVTCDEFVNKRHKDRDASKYAFGLFTLVDRANGHLYHRGVDAPRGNTLGARFVLNDYNIDVNLDATDGVIEMLWNSQIHHQTTASKTFNAQNKRIPAGSAEITRFACSCQISQALVNRLNRVQSLQSTMSEADWISYQASVLTGYKEQAHQKMKALAIKYGIWQEDF